MNHESCALEWSHFFQNRKRSTSSVKRLYLRMTGRWLCWNCKKWIVVSHQHRSCKRCCSLPKLSLIRCVCVCVCDHRRGSFGSPPLRNCGVLLQYAIEWRRRMKHEGKVPTPQDIPSLGGDDFFPVFTFVLVRANLREPLATRHLLTTVCNPSMLQV
jgi:hypothetical protein